MIRVVAIFLFVSMLVTGCDKVTKDVVIDFETTEGTFSILLFDETPRHRDNMIALVNDGFYDGLLFHRVQPGFTVETGDPNSRKKSRSRRLGIGGPGYTIESEVDTVMNDSGRLFHFCGAVSACRLPEDINPELKSNGSQFFVTIGKCWTNEELDSLEKADYESRLDLVLQRLVMKNRGLIDGCRQWKDGDRRVVALEDSLAQEAATIISKQKTLRFSARQRSLYTTVGGEPDLDGRYTVFGEVVDGLDLLKRISEAPTDAFGRPLQDVRIIKAKVKR